MLGVHREFGGKRTSRGTREDGEQTRRNDKKQKHEEEHVERTLNTSNRLKFSIEEFSWENKKGPKKAFKGHCGYCGEFGHKAADCPHKKSNQNKGQKPKNKQKKGGGGGLQRKRTY